MSKVVIIVAIEFDILIDEFHMKKSVINESGYSYFTMSYNTMELIFFKSGPGEIQAAAGIQYAINKFDPEFILNVGVCGGIDPSIRKGDLCIINDFVHTDYDVSCVADTLPGQYIGLSSEKIRLNENLSDYCEEYLKEKNTVYRVSLASQDKVIDGDKMRTDFGNRWNCQICDMELAGYGLIALKNKVPLISLKIVSDSVGDEAAFDSEWEKEFRDLTDTIAGLASHLLNLYKC